MSSGELEKIEPSMFGPRHGHPLIPTKAIWVCAADGDPVAAAAALAGWSTRAICIGESGAQACRRAGGFTQVESWRVDLVDMTTLDSAERTGAPAPGAGLAGLTFEVPVVSVDCPIQDVDRMFRDNRHLKAVVVNDGTRATLLAREHLEYELSGRFGYGRALHNRSVAGELVTGATLTLPADVSLADAAGLVLARDPSTRYHDVLVLGGPTPVVVSVSAIFERLSEMFRHASLHDALTGLPNRVLLADRLDQALRTGRRAGTTAGLLLIDLDRFKLINDTFGHRYGDELLARVGPRLRAALRDSDTVARLGGDEFAVLLPDIGDVAAATAVAEKLRQTLERPFRIEDIDLDIEASVGVVVSGDHGSDAATLLQRVDIAMYVAKAQNLGAVAYDPAVDYNSPERLALLGELRRALERDEICLYYQPQVSVSTGEVVGVEALARWRHPTRGLVPPDSFIPVAERTGLIGPMTHYILDAALAQARCWLDAGRALRVSVNLSARNLLDEALPDQIAELLKVHGVPASLLELEVTESAIITEPQRARRLLRRLSELGMRISIDDFGAGYTSLGQLKTLPITELKIDRSFVTNMTNDDSDALIVHSVVDLGHNLGMTIVAEGVENDEVLQRLARFGCDVAQGYHILRPAPIASFDTWCKQQRLAPVPREVKHPRTNDDDETDLSSLMAIG